MKICKVCAEDETKVVFAKHRLMCRECLKKRHKTYPSTQRAHRTPYLRQWRQDNPRKQREYELKASYNASPEQMETILNWKGGPCSACGKHLVKFGTGADDACVDHDHLTEVLRGIVCGACNRALGYVQDSIERLKQLEAYLRGERVCRYW